jgi:hypothetical protein
MTTRWHRVVVAASLHNVGDCSAIDLKVESQIPSKVRSPQNNQTPPSALSGGSSDRDNANKNKNEKDSGWGGES